MSNVNLEEIGQRLIEELAKEMPQLPLSNGSVFDVDWTNINHVAVACYAIAMTRGMELGSKNTLNIIEKALEV